MALLDSHGKTVHTQTAGLGLVAALRYQDDQPVWVVTGTDERGVASAARALNAHDLADHFAVATIAGINDTVFQLPDIAGGP